MDCPERKGLGFKPEVNGHVLQSLGIMMPRVEDHSNVRPDRAYPFTSQVVGLFDEPGPAGEDSSGGAPESTSLLVYSGRTPLSWTLRKWCGFR